MTYGVVGRLLLRTVDDDTRHTRDHDDRSLDALLDHVLTSFLGKQKGAIDIDIQHTLPVIKVVVFGCNTTRDTSIRAQNVDFAEVLYDLGPGLLDGGFVCCVAFIGTQVCFGKVFFLYFGVNGFDGF